MRPNGAQARRDAWFNACTSKPRLMRPREWTLCGSAQNGVMRRGHIKRYKIVTLVASMDAGDRLKGGAEINERVRVIEFARRDQRSGARMESAFRKLASRSRGAAGLRGSQCLGPSNRLVSTNAILMDSLNLGDAQAITIPPSRAIRGAQTGERITVSSLHFPASS